MVEGLVDDVGVVEELDSQEDEDAIGCDPDSGIIGIADHPHVSVHAAGYVSTTATFA